MQFSTINSCQAIISYESVESFINKAIANYKPSPKLDSLPKDILLHIFEYLPKDLTNILSINSQIFRLKYDFLAKETHLTYRFIQHAIITTLRERKLLNMGSKYYQK